ncbi:chitinase [Luteibacter rhizovicinus DSM 16549]|uniref:Chitinase n=1 Tax=Luteibacter rhizovicinus DSM 16549 TaxID=1440763 RepID=A0A1L3EV81_9GAMM|nr:glycoside hydrolase family 19 protein [Luteibacter rhizovicinus]APG04942.1 chitinase [Luteibacter rhizovicinus DSM 16549]
MDAQLLSKAVGISLPRAKLWIGPLTTAMDLYDIDSGWRVSAFLAQVGHESMGFSRTREMWGPTDQQRGYEGRHDLGNTQPGDGSRFMGRGLIMITGRNNYAAASTEFGVDFVHSPTLLEREDYASLTAGWWWKAHHCNEIADSRDFIALTRKINGGLTGIDDRKLRWERAKFELGVQ